MLRPYQQIALDEFKNSDVCTGKSVIIEMPIGLGKAGFKTHKLYIIQLNDRIYETTDNVEAWSFCLTNKAVVIEEKEVNYEAKIFVAC